MNTTLQTITCPHTGSSKITPPTTSSWRGLFRMSLKHLAVLVIMLTVGIESVLAEDTYFPSGNGDGSSSKPFQITNVAELQSFGSMYANHPDDWETYKTKHYILTDDLTLTGTNNYTPAGSNGTTSVAFTGTFNGNNKTISKINITSSEIKTIGFIGSLTGTIKDLTINNSTIISTYNIGISQVGGIIGIINNGASVLNCDVNNCTISGGNGNTYVGGIIGQVKNDANSASTAIRDCDVKGSTSIEKVGDSPVWFGAIIGLGCNYATLSNNYYEWTVKRKGNYVPYDKRGWGVYDGNYMDKEGAQIEPVNSWAALKRALSVGVTGSGVITLTGNCVDNPTTNNFLNVPTGVTAKVDLNGYTINRNYTSYFPNAAYVLTVSGTLTINDGSTNKTGTITGGYWESSSAGIINNSGNLTINGGNISENNGTGVFNTGTLTIKGGTISNNSKYGISNFGTLYVYGGTITNNGSGGLYTDRDIHIKGTINISNNTQYNVQLTSTSKMIVDGNLTNCSIGVTAAGSPRVITSGLSGKGNVSNFFYATGNNGSYAVRLQNSGEAAIKESINPIIAMDGWTYGEAASDPSISSGNKGNGTVTYTYKAAEQTDYSETKPTNAGTHTVKATIAETDLYLEKEKTQNYTVTQREVTLSWDNTSLTYNGSEQKPTAEAGNLVNSDACTVTVSGVQTNAGNGYTATATELSNSNYKLPAANTHSFSIAQKDIIVSGITASDKTYDGNTTATIVATNASFDGLLDGDALSVSTSGTFADANVGTGKTVTFDALTLGGTSVGNYQLAASGQQTTTTADITKKALTVTANNHSITYGDAPDNNGVNYSEFVEGEGTGNLSGTLDYDYSYAQYGNVGNTYTITPKGLTSNNYDISFQNGTLTVNQKEVGLNWSTDSPFTYDGQSHCLSATATGMVNSDEIGVTVTGAQTSAGDSYTATASELTGTKSGNYKLPAANTQPFTINRRAVTVTPSDGQSKTYGDSDPTITYNVDGLLGLVPGESLSGTLERAAGKDVNTYAITQGTVTDANNDNYTITFTTGKTFAITPKTIGISWGPTILTYNSSAQAPTATATGLVDSDVCNLSVTGQQTAVGVYTITDAPATVTALDNTNYQLPTTGLTTGFEIVNPLSISFAANQLWATWYGGYNFEVPTGMTAYKVSSVSGSTVTVDEITYVPANTGILIKRTATDAAVVNSNVYNGETSAITSLLRNGSPTPYSDYILYNDGFVLSSVSTIGEHRCYLPGTGTASTRGLTIDLGDETTDISPKTAEVFDSEEWFDLQGRRIEKPQKKGLYIRDGKKVVIK